MTVFFDTSAPGGLGPITASGQVFFFNVETPFYLTAVSTLIPGQSVGPSVTFTINSRVTGELEQFNVDYGQPPTAPRPCTGYMVTVTVPTGSGINPVSIRCVISDMPTPLGGPSIRIATNSNLPNSKTGTSWGLTSSYAPAGASTTIVNPSTSTLVIVIDKVVISIPALTGGGSIDIDLVVILVAGGGSQYISLWGKSALAASATFTFAADAVVGATPSVGSGSAILSTFNTRPRIYPGESFALAGLTTGTVAMGGNAFWVDWHYETL